MITRDQFFAIAREALENPRASLYTVDPLSRTARPYPFRLNESAVPAMVLQFGVVRNDNPAIRRVISIARYSQGYALWCGDKFTQGDVSELEAGIRIGAAVSTVPKVFARQAREAMELTYGSYPDRADCHFWKAWHSHQGVCKHVAAVLQDIDHNYIGGLDAMLTHLDNHFEYLMKTPPEFFIDA